MKAIHSKINEHLQWKLCQLKLSSNKCRLTVSFLDVFKVEHDVCFAGEVCVASSQLHVSAYRTKYRTNKCVTSLSTLTLSSTCFYSVDVVATGLSYRFLNAADTPAQSSYFIYHCARALLRQLMLSLLYSCRKDFLLSSYTWPWDCQMFRQLLGNSTNFYHLPSTTSIYSWLRLGLGLRMRSDLSYLNEPHCISSIL